MTHQNQSKDPLGDRMKLYEHMGVAGMRTTPLLPTFCRLDGMAFHTFTRGLQRPYDPRLSTLMQATTKFLVQETGANVGYTQSDEITLAWYRPDFKSQMYFDGKMGKLTSILAAMTSVYFNAEMERVGLGEKKHMRPLFDCRVWTVPTLVEAVNVFIWREQDATRNSISMAAQSFYSHRQLYEKNTDEMQEMLFQKGVNWNDYPPFFKRGSYFRRFKVTKPLTADELATLPPLHEARKNPDLAVERSVIDEIEMPPILKVTNKIDVLFDGAEPIQIAAADMKGNNA